MAQFEETSIGFKTIFQQTFNDTGGGAKDHATLVNSANLSEKYVWLGNFPNVTEWVGDRDVKTLTDFGYSIVNKPFEQTITVSLDDIKYDRIGVHTAAIAQLGQNAKLFGAELVASVIIDGHAKPCYDGKNFFAVDHLVGETTYANRFVGELTEANLLAGITHLLSIKNSAGKTMRVKATKLVAGPLQLSTLIKLIDSPTLSAGVANPCYKIIEYEILPEITDKAWFLEDLSKVIKPYILQVAVDGEFEASNNHSFMKNAALFGTKSFMNAGYGLWQLACRFSGTATDL